MGWWTDTISTATSAANLNRFRADSVELDDTGALTNTLRVTPAATKGTSTSTGGAVNVTMTGAVGAGVVVYTNRGSDAGGRMMVLRSSNAAFNQQAMFVQYAGTNHAVAVDHQGTGTSSLALSVTSTNADDTVAGFTGATTTRAVVKVTHNGGSGTSGALLTLQKNGADTAAQGIFGDTEDGTATGKWINLRHNGTEVLVVDADGTIHSKGAPLSPTVHSVVDYGATGDGSTDDTTAIAAALTAADTDGGIVWLPPGDYVVSSTLTVPTNVQFKGAGSGSVTLSHTANGVCIKYGNDGGFHHHGMHLEGFLIEGNTGAAACGIEMGDFYDASIRDVVVDDYTAGVGVRFLNLDYWCEGMHLDQVRVRNCAEGVVFERHATLSSYNSFGYANIRGLSINVPASGTGIRVGAETGSLECWLYNTRLECVFWLGTGATAIRVTGNGTVSADVMLTGEPESAATSTTWIDNDGYFAYTGSMWVTPDSFTTIHAGANDPFRYNAMPVGSASSVATGIMGAPHDFQLHAGLGLVNGANVAYPVLWGYDYPGSTVLQVSARPYTGNTNSPWDADSGSVFEVNADGDVTAVGGITAAGQQVLTEREATFTITGDAAVATGTKPYRVGEDCTITSVEVTAGVGPEGDDLILDVNRNGTTIYGTQANRPTVLDGETEGSGGAASNGTLTAGDRITIDVDQIGVAEPGAEIVIQVRMAS